MKKIISNLKKLTFIDCVDLEITINIEVNGDTLNEKDFDFDRKLRQIDEAMKDLCNWSRLENFANIGENIKIIFIF